MSVKMYKNSNNIIVSFSLNSIAMTRQRLEKHNNN